MGWGQFRDERFTVKGVLFRLKLKNSDDVVRLNIHVAACEFVVWYSNVITETF